MPVIEPYTLGYSDLAAAVRVEFSAVPTRSCGDSDAAFDDLSVGFPPSVAEGHQ